MQYDVLIKNGLIYDGHGGAPYRADIAVQNGVIAKIGNIEGEGKQKIDASDFIVTC